MIKVNSYLIFVLILFLGLQNVLSQEENSFIKIDSSDRANPWTHLNWHNKAENFQFVVVTDRTGGARPGVFEHGIEKINQLQPEFVVSVGDLIEGYSDDPDQVIKEWEEMDKIIEPLQMPFFYVPGNHDISNDVMADIWKERFGATYYHFVYRNVLFLCLNSEDAPDEIDEEEIPFSQEQINFIRQTLEANPNVRWTMVFIHKPIWFKEQREGKEALEKSGWAEIESMLKDRKHTVIAGHVHRYTHNIRNNSNYITMSTMGGGRAFGGTIFGQFDHVMWVTMTDNGPIMANLMLEGIWDEDFTEEDIADYLFMTMHGTSISIETDFVDDKPLSSRDIEIKLSNPRDIPMDIIIYFEKSEHHYYTPETIQKTIQPNSVEKVSAFLNVTTETETPDESDEDEEAEGLFWLVWKDIANHPINWEISYNFMKYGKVSFQGKTLVYW